MRILGIDPGSYNTGYGLIDVHGSKMSYVTHGVWALNSKAAFSDRLLQLGNELEKALAQHQPQVVVIEQVFLGKNVVSAFKLGHVRGVCMFWARRFHATVEELPARRVKKVVTGDGGASKEHVQLILANELGIARSSSLDASDALALAVCFTRELDVKRRLQEMDGMR